MKGHWQFYVQRKQSNLINKFNLKVKLKFYRKFMKQD